MIPILSGQKMKTILARLMRITSAVFSGPLIYLLFQQARSHRLRALKAVRLRKNERSKKTFYKEYGSSPIQKSGMASYIVEPKGIGLP